MSEISFRQELLRKSVHISSLWIVLFLFFSQNIVYPRFVISSIFIFLAAVNYLLEYAVFRECDGFAIRIYRKLFSRMLRENNGKFRPSGSPPFLAAAGVCVLLFGNYIAAYSISVMILADTSAALIGRQFGKHRFSNGKSWEGTLSFFITAIIVFLIWMPFFQKNGMEISKMLFFGISGCVVAAVLELFNTELKLDDNFSIPLACGLGMLLAEVLS